MRRLVAVLLLVAAMLLPWGGSQVAQATRQRGAAPANRHSMLRIEAAEPANAPGLVVRVGLHLRNIYNLSLIDQSFLAEGWYRLDWGDDVEALLQKENIKPEEMVELANEIELGQYSMRDVSTVPVVMEKPGRHGLWVRFSGKFYILDVPQRYAPFDPQQLMIALEVEPDILARGPRPLRLEPATDASQILGERVELSGYELDSVSWERSQVIYPNDLFPGLRFSRLSAVLVYGKNEWAMFLKWIFPVLVVMAVVILSPSIEGVLGDARLAIPPSALLTLVVMQDGYKSSFPPAPYLTYLDELYVYSYIVCLAIFLLFLVGTNIVVRAGAEDSAELRAQRVNRIDTVVQLGLVGGFVLVGVLGWFT